MDAGGLVSIGELRSSSYKSERDNRAAPCIFSPDGCLLAWIHAPYSVLILPTPDSRPAFEDVVGGESASRLSGGVVISTGVLVCAMAFGRGRPLVRLCRGTGDTRYNRDSLVFATGHKNGRVRLWCPYSGQLLLHLMDHQAAVRALQFAPDASRRLVTVSEDRTVKVWDLDDEGNMLKTIGECRAPLFRCDWRADGADLVTCGISNLVYVLDMSGYHVKCTLRGHMHEVTSCCYSGDGSIVLSSSLDSTARLWDSVSGECLMVLCHLVPKPSRIFASGANGSWVSSASLSPDCSQVVTVGEDSQVRVWNVSGDVLSCRRHQPQCHAVGDSLRCQATPDALTWCTLNQAGTVTAVGTSLFDVHFYSVPSLVAPLKHLARLALRRLVPSDRFCRLPLPPTLVAYLNFGRQCQPAAGETPKGAQVSRGHVPLDHGHRHWLKCS